MHLQNNRVIRSEFPVSILVASALFSACGILCTVFNFASDVLQPLFGAYIGNFAAISVVFIVLYVLIAVSGVSPLGFPIVMLINCAFGFALTCVVRTFAASVQILTVPWIVSFFTVFLLSAALLALSVRAGAFSSLTFKRIGCDASYRGELFKYCLFSFITVAVIVSVFFAAALLI